MQNKDVQKLNEHIKKTLETTIAAYLKNEVVVKVVSGESTLDTVNAATHVQSLNLRIHMHIEPRTSAVAISEVALLPEE